MSQHKALYNTARWKRRRLAQLEAEPLCRYCKALGKITQATIADHVVPHRGDHDLFFNGKLASSCKPCHDGMKQELEKSGTMRGGDTNGVPIDPAHHWNR